MITMNWLRSAAALTVMLVALPAGADVKLPAVIGDNMVLQRDLPLPIWGTADPGESVTVTIGEESRSTTAGADGRWLVRLSPLKRSGPVAVSVVGNNSIDLENVLLGEVWVCSGQSNMEMPVKLSNNPEEEIAAADYPKIRMFSAKHTVADEPQADVEGRWVECSPENIPGFSAVAYFFGGKLQEMVGRPVGLVKSAWGGTPAESWTSREALAADGELAPIRERWAHLLESHPERMKEYREKLAAWKTAAEAAKAAGEKPTRQPRPPLGPNHPHRPSSLYNGMISPLVPFAIRGAIWYQGESNAKRAYQYRKLFSTMIQDWRNNWDQGDFPFLFVQLANFYERAAEPGESNWAELREAQTMALSLPNTGMAVTIDIGEAKDIHPRNKQDVGVRLALAAGAVAYGQGIIPSGPMYKSATIESGRVRLYFDHVGGGLSTEGKGGLRGFAIAGEDRKFVWANAEIDGDSIVVSSADVAEPVAVRYGWANNPDCNLYNEAGLPASPFRTDTWPGITVENK